MVPIDSEFYRECPEQKNFEKVIMWSRDLVIADQKKRSRDKSGANRFSISWRTKVTKKFWENIHVRVWFSDYRQTRSKFLTDRAQSGTIQFRMLPGVSWTKKKIEKGGEKKFKGMGVI